MAGSPGGSEEKVRIPPFTMWVVTRKHGRWENGMNVWYAAPRAKTGPYIFGEFSDAMVSSNKVSRLWRCNFSVTYSNLMFNLSVRSS